MLRFLPQGILIYEPEAEAVTFTNQAFDELVKSPAGNQAGHA